MKISETTELAAETHAFWIASTAATIITLIIIVAIRPLISSMTIISSSISIDEECSSIVGSSGRNL